MSKRPSSFCAGLLNNRVAKQLQSRGAQTSVRCWNKNSFCCSHILALSPLRHMQALEGKSPVVAACARGMRAIAAPAFRCPDVTCAPVPQKDGCLSECDLATSSAIGLPVSSLLVPSPPFPH